MNIYSGYSFDPEDAGSSNLRNVNSNGHFLGLLDMLRHIWENLWNESKGDILDIHYGCETHSYLFCHCTVVQI
jgi:hypothetical protein